MASRILNYVNGTGVRFSVNVKSFAEMLKYHLVGGFDSDTLVELMQEMKAIDEDIFLRALDSRYLNSSEKKLLKMMYQHYIS